MSDQSGDEPTVVLPSFVNYYTIIKDAILFVAILPTLYLVYAITVFFSRKKFRSAFEKICYLSIVTDMILFFVDIFAWDMASCGVFSYYSISSGFVPSAFTFVQCAARFFQFFCILLIAFNRMTTMYWKIERNYLFWLNYVNPMIISCFIISLLVAVGYIWSSPFYVQIAPNVWILAAGLEPIFNTPIGILGTIFLAALVFVTLILNVLVLAKLLQIRRRNQLRESLAVKIERRLCFVGLYTFIFEFCYIFSQICNQLVVLHSTQLQTMFLFMAPLSGNLLCIATVWIWVFHSSELRSQIFQKFAPTLRVISPSVFSFGTTPPALDMKMVPK